MRTLEELNEHFDTFEENTLRALESIVEEQLAKVVTTLEQQKDATKALCIRVAALEMRPMQRSYGGPNA